MTLRMIDPANVTEIAQLLSRAMFNDPLAANALPDPELRERLLPGLFEPMARYCALFGEVHAADDPVTGAAIWLPPGETEMTPERIEAAGLDRLPSVLGEEPAGLFFGVMEHMDSVHSAAMTGAHWYLQVIGVDPSAQKSGTGRRLLDHVLTRADEMGHACYLETFAEGTLGYYQALGFEIAEAGRDPVIGLDYWAMRRAARVD